MQKRVHNEYCNSLTRSVLFYISFVSILNSRGLIESDLLYKCLNSTTISSLDLSFNLPPITTVVMPQKDKITLFWLPHTRAQRIVWLLEELGLEYNLHMEESVQLVRAPESYKKYFPLGKVPIVHIEKPDGTVKKFGESGFIVQYLVEHYDTTGKFKPTTEDDKELVDYFNHYSEGTIQPLLVGLLVNNVAGKSMPFPVSVLVKTVVGKIDQGYYQPELEKNVEYLNDFLKAQHSKGRKWFVGDKISAADIMLSFPIQNVITTDYGATVKPIKETYPDVYQYFQDITSEPAWVRAAEKVKNYDQVVINGKL